MKNQISTYSLKTSSKPETDSRVSVELTPDIQDAQDHWLQKEEKSECESDQLKSDFKYILVILDLTTDNTQLKSNVNT